MNKSNLIENPWSKLRSFTDARIALGRAGTSIPTHHWLEFQLAHAQAQDAVHSQLASDDFAQQMTQQLGIAEPLLLHSQAQDRAEYLQRPDLGRHLDAPSIDTVTQYMSQQQSTNDLAIVIADGLSCKAIEENAIPFLTQLLPELPQEWRIAPLCLVEQGRVAIGDHIGELLNAKLVLVLIGERPGLSSPDSLGLYLTWAPEVGLTDASRNCISNVRPAGLSYSEAVTKSLYLLYEARRLQLTGVNLKEDAAPEVLEGEENSDSLNAGSFLISDI